MSSAHNRGRFGEELAASHLRSAGFRVLARNFRSRFGEIDIVAGRRDLLLFIEVKARRSTRFGHGLDSVDERKQRRLVQAARWYLARYGTGQERVRFDVIEVHGNDAGDAAVTSWIEGAFRADAV